MFLTPPQVAKLLQVKPDTVRAWIVSGRMPALNLALPGKRAQYRITQEQLNQFQARCTVVKAEKPQSRRQTIPFQRYA